MTIRAEDWVARSTVDPAVFARWPGYRVTLLACDMVDQAALAATAAALLDEAHTAARGGAAAPAEPADADPHTVQWQDAYREFGVKPRVARPSSDALIRRAASDKGLPSINVLVDLYNALSVLHRVPIGGEDLDRYAGAAQLVLASGDEPFVTGRDDETSTEHPDPGEPVWIDDEGVTCRRWNWRQTSRTAIDATTTRVGFIVDSLAAPAHDGADAVEAYLLTLLPDAVVRSIDASSSRLAG